MAGANVARQNTRRVLDTANEFSHRKIRADVGKFGLRKMVLS